MWTATRNRTRRTALLGPALVLALTWACKTEEAAPPAAEPAQSAQPAPAGRPAGQAGPTRTEQDLLGEKEVPADAYYGVQTAARSRTSRSRACRSTTIPGSSKRGPSSSWPRRGPTPTSAP